MTVSIVCANASCQARASVDEALLGKKARCKKCGTTFVLTRTNAEPPAPANSQAGWQAGDVILDLYEVKGVLGEGGMGTVYHVHHKGWNRDLAVKSPRRDLLARPGAVEDFEREAETWVKLGLYAHTVSCFYVRRIDGIPRVFAEYVPGGSLRDWIDRGTLYEGGPQQALERILDIAIQFAWGLHHAHEQGLVHQDVKPANVMMTADGVAKVTDFGLAKARSAAGEAPAVGGGKQTILVSSGGYTPAYCSPEQANHQPLSRKTDVWSWAVSVLEMFTGEVTWLSGSVAGDALEGYLQVSAEDERLPRMPHGLAVLLRRCFHADPSARPRDMLEVVPGLQMLYGQLKGHTHPRERPEPAEGLADSLNNWAVSFFDLGKQAEAEAKWQEALRVDAHHAEATYNWGLIQWRSARMTDWTLLGRLQEVRTSAADTSAVDYLRALVHLERGDVPAAIRVLNEVVEAGTGRPDVAAALALAQSMKNPAEDVSRNFRGGGFSVSWSPDGQYALSGGTRKMVELWEVSSGKSLRTFEGHTDWVRSVSWSPDGRFALSGSNDKTLRLWEVSSGKCVRTFQGHTDKVQAVSWSPDSRLVLSGSRDLTLRLWEVSSGKCLRSFKGHTRYVTSVSWSPDGRCALSGSDDTTLRLWEVSSGQCLRTFQRHTDEVASASWSRDGCLALSGSRDRTLRLWEVSSGQCLRSFEGHTDAVTSVSWDPDGRLALSGSSDHTLRLWEVSTGRCLRTFEGHWYKVTSVSLSPDGRLALSGCEGGMLRIWGIAFGRQPVPLVTSLPFTARSATYHHLCAQVRDALRSNPVGAAEFLQQARQQPGCSRREEAMELARALSRSLSHCRFVGGWEKRTFEGHKEQVTSVAWSADGRAAISGSDDKTVRLWEVSSGQCLRTFEGHTRGVTSVSWSPDGRCALSGSNDNTLRLWEVSSGKFFRTFEGHTSSVNPVSWSPDGRTALSGSYDKTLRLWDVSSGKCLRTFEGHTDNVTTVSWSPDGRSALSGSSDKTLRLWEVSSGKCLRSFEGHTSSLTSAAWSPDGRFILSGSFEVTLRLWEVSSGKCLRTLEDQMLGRSSVSWSPDSRYALAGSGDDALRLWEVSSGKRLHSFGGHMACVTSVSWSPDGRFALTGSSDKTLRLWELDWEFEPNQPANWDDGARPHLINFLSIHAPLAGTLPKGREPTDAELTLSLTRRGKPAWTEEDYRRLLDTLGCAGYGWLRPEGVRRELTRMAAAWTGPPPLV